MTTRTATAVHAWPARGPSLPRPSGGFGNLINTFVQGIAHALGWRAGVAIANVLGPTVLIALAVLGVAVWLLSRRKARRRTRR